MPVTLAQAALNAENDIDRNVIDEFRKSSYLLDALTFDNVVNPAGGGATLTYGYTRLVTQPTAAFRAINAEYTPQEVTKQQYTVDLKPLGGSFQIDRVLSLIAAGAEVALQMSQKVKATNAKFSDEVINGDVAVDANGFDGLDKALTGTANELHAADTAVGTGMDWTTVASQADAFAALAQVDELIASLDGMPNAILGNRYSITKLKQLARWAGYLSPNEDAFGRVVETYGGIALVDLGEKPGSTNPIIPVESRDLDAGGPNPAVTGLTDIYAVRFGLDGFHAVSVVGDLVKTWLPDFSTSGAVKTGEVEMGPVAVALKATKSSAVLRNVKVQ